MAANFDAGKVPIKVPAVTFGWVIRILADTLGEAGGESVTTSSLGKTTDHSTPNGFRIGTTLLATALALVSAQIAARKFHARRDAAFVVCLLWTVPAAAGPPFVTDDPEPVETGHWEDYLFVEDMRAAGQSSVPVTGIEINYGVFEDTQLSMSMPLGTNPGPGGIGVVWSPLSMGVKYRCVDEDEKGWRPQIAFFPSIAIPVGHSNAGAPVTELLPIWIQKSFGAWTAFGGGGYTNNPGRGNRNFGNYGIAIQDQVIKRLALGVELFGAGKDADSSHSTTAVGLGALYDFNDLWHVVGSINKGIHNRLDADQFSYNLALKWTP